MLLINPSADYIRFLGAFNAIAYIFLLFLIFALEIVVSLGNECSHFLPFTSDFLETSPSMMNVNRSLELEITSAEMFVYGFAGTSR